MCTNKWDVTADSGLAFCFYQGSPAGPGDTAGDRCLKRKGVTSQIHTHLDWPFPNGVDCLAPSWSVAGLAGLPSSLGKLSGAHYSGTAAHPLHPALSHALRNCCTFYYRYMRTHVQIITTHEDMRDPLRRESGRLVPLASSGIPHLCTLLEILEIPTPN